MNNSVWDIPEELLDILEELVIHEEENKQEERHQPYLEIEIIEDFRIPIEPEAEKEERNIIHIQL